MQDFAQLSADQN
jgi:hypothetical protein